jgi:hypothetical protein
MKYLFSLIIVFSSFIQLNAQMSKWQVRADYYEPRGFTPIQNASVNGYTFPRNWGFSVGAEYDWLKTDRSRLYQYLTMGGFNYPYWERAFTFDIGVGYNFRAYEGLFVGSEFSVGFNRATSSNLISVYEDNKWVSKPDFSVVTISKTATYGFQLGYDLGRHFKWLPLTITGGYTGSINREKPTFVYSQPRFGLKWHF